MYMCPVCGYPKLENKPYNDKGLPSEDICPCCGFQFGCDDNYDLNNISKYHSIWRDNWIKNGSIWFSRKTSKPDNFNFKEQLKNLKK